jgi:hypothetical protein
MRTSEGMPPSALFEHLLKVVSSSRFLQKRGLGNEVPYAAMMTSGRPSMDSATRLATSIRWLR